MRRSYLLFVMILLLTHLLAGQVGAPQAIAAPPEQQLASPTSAGDRSTVKLTVKAMVIDRDLNAKPIPKFVFNLQVVTDQVDKAEVQTLTTRLDGTVEIQLFPGRYRIVSAKPLDFEGKHFSWDMQFTVVPSGTTLELSNDNAKIVEGGPSVVDDLTSVFKKYRDTVVTVWAEVGAGHGTGFIVDPAGLVITNQHVVTTSEYIAVQFDQDRTLPAIVLASDPTKDVAVLWVNVSKVPEAQAAPLLNRRRRTSRGGGESLHHRKPSPSEQSNDDGNR